MLKRKLIITICIIASGGLMYPQTGLNNQRSIADSLRDTGDLKGAISEYRKSYEKDSGNQRNLYKYACALSVDRQIDSCFKYLNLFIEMTQSISPLTDPDLIPAREDKLWPGFENKLIAMYNKQNNNIVKDIEYAKILWKLMALDQAYFTEIGLAIRKIGPNTTVVRALARLKDIQNELNQKELAEAISKKGWPKKSEVGDAAAGAAFYVFQHSNTELQKKYLPMLKQRCKEKEANWIHYGMMYDRMKVNQNLPQKYGTQPVSFNNTSSPVIALEDESKVDEWRKEIGLPPLTIEQRKQFNKK